MRIRQAASADVAPLARLMAASPLLRRYAVTTSRARAELREALRERDLLLVASEGPAPLGLAWVIRSRALDRSAYLRLLLVAEGRQSRGAGARLLAQAERVARSRGARHLVLLVTASNLRARRFYERSGYRRAGELAGFVRPRLSEALYHKSLR